MFIKHFIIIIFLIYHCFTPHLQGQTHFYFVEDASNLGGNCYRITPNLTFQRGAVWALHQLDLNQDFNLDFSISFGSNDANGADGITFCLHNTCSDAGIAGGGIGYEGITSSLAVEFDTWENTNLMDPWYDHLAIISNGNVNHGATSNLAGPIQASASNVNIEDGAFHNVLIQWQASSQTFQIFFDGSLRLSYTGNIVNNIFGGDSKVNWGFTGSTGGSTNQQDFCINNYPTPVTLSDTEICGGESVQVNLPTGLNYTWTPNVGITNPSVHNPLLSPSTSTLYTVTITDNCGRTSTDNIQIDVKSPPQLDDQTNIICVDGTTILALNETYPDYLWSDGSTESTLLVDAVGTYWVEVGNECGIERVNFEVELSIPEINLNHIEEVYCNTAPTIDLSNGIYELDGNPVVSLNFAELPTGTYTLTYTFIDPNTTCSNTVSKDFEVLEGVAPIINESQICSFSGETLLLDAGEGNNYFWYEQEVPEMPLSFSRYLEIAEAGVYLVSLVNDSGCETENTFNVSEFCEPLIFFPEAFSPNGDGINDLFRVFGKHFNKYQIQIFNRWGEVVYFSENPEHTWDGTYRQKILPSGAYVYEVQYKPLPEGELIKETRYLHIVR